MLAGKWNFAINGKFSGSEGKFYQAKFFNGFVQADRPTLLIVNASEADGIGDLENSTETGKDCAFYLNALGIPANQSSACFQLDPAAIQPPLPNEPVWFRMEIRESASTGDPIITASIAWHCDDGQPMHLCVDESSNSTFFSTSRTEFGDPNDMSAVNGTWLLEPHDDGAFVYVFRTGLVD